MLLKLFQKNPNRFRYLLFHFPVITILLLSSFNFWGCSSSVPLFSTVPVRGYLYGNDGPSSQFPIIGYLLFTHRPDSAELTRYNIIFEEYQKYFEIRSSYDTTDHTKYAITYWMLLKDKKEYIDNYNYFRSTELLAKIGCLGKSGPVLFAYNNQTGHMNLNDNILIMDLSNFSNADIDRAFRIWKERIAMNPDKWKDGFKLELLKEDFRNLIDTYGDNIVSVLKNFL